jgi:hypothetical protein
MDFLKAVGRDCRTGIVQQRLIPKVPRIEPDNFSPANVIRQTNNRYNVTHRPARRSRDTPRSPAAAAVAPRRVYLCVSLFLCSPLFASSLLPRPVQLALLRRSLRLRFRPRSPASSTSSSSRRYCVRGWQATARPLVSGSAVGSSATLIASNVIVLSADPSAAKPSLGKPWEGICFRLQRYRSLSCRSSGLSVAVASFVVATINTDRHRSVDRHAALTRM